MQEWSKVARDDVWRLHKSLLLVIFLVGLGTTKFKSIRTVVEMKPFITREVKGITGVGVVGGSIYCLKDKTFYQRQYFIARCLR
jgi:hypothetical protein